jgi:hypothetical protein
MPKSSDWGELKQSKTYRITPTASGGIDGMAESLGLSSNELVERLGRAFQDEVGQKTFFGVLTGTIMQMQNKRVSEKLERKK